MYWSSSHRARFCNGGSTSQTHSYIILLFLIIRLWFLGKEGVVTRKVAVLVEGNSSDNSVYTMRGLQPHDPSISDNAAASASASATPPVEDGKWQIFHLTCQPKTTNRTFFFFLVCFFFFFFWPVALLLCPAMCFHTLLSLHCDLKKNYCYPDHKVGTSSLTWNAKHMTL